MDPTSALGAAQQAFSAAFGLARVAGSAAINHEVKAKVIDVQEAILDAQAKLEDAQAERLDLLHQVAELKDKVRALEVADALLHGYELHEVEPGKFLYKPRDIEDGKPLHYACPRCYSGGKIAVVQGGSWSTATRYKCSVCPFILYVGCRD